MMRKQISWVVLSMFVGCISSTSLYAADPVVPSGPPQTGDETLAKKDAEVMRGKLLKVEGELYTIETSPGKQVTARTGNITKFEKNFKGMEGDWIEAMVAPDMLIQSVKKSTPAYTLEGDVLKVDGNFLTVTGEGGKEVRLQTGKDTQLTGSHKVGDRIRAEYTPDGQVLSIKPVKIPRGPGGA
jgi:hypothetical protein